MRAGTKRLIKKIVIVICLVGFIQICILAVLEKADDSTSVQNTKLPRGGGNEAHVDGKQGGD